MNSNFERKMAEAARLMQSGRLGAATAAIQSAMGVAMPVPTPTMPAAHGTAEAPPARGDVIDVVAREVGATWPDSQAADRFIGGQFHNASGAREYRLFEPARDGRPLPLVVMLHGCTQDPDDFAHGTGMNELARQQGFAVLYPAQAQRANTARCWNWFKHNHQARDRGEPGILAGMVRDVIARHQLDDTRVYVAGLSAGGAMAAILGDAYPDVFAAVGVHSGLPTGSATDVQSAFAAMSGGAPANRRARRATPAPPTIVFQGDADTTVNPLNAERVIEAMALPADLVERQELGTAGRDFSRRQWLTADGATAAELWTIHGAGHAWSGGRPEGSYTDARGPNASAEMLRFFNAHRRR